MSSRIEGTSLYKHHKLLQLKLPPSFNNTCLYVDDRVQETVCFALYLGAKYIQKMCVHRSHRMGHSSSESAGTRNPRPVTVKFTSYEPCRAISTAKRKLKGNNVVITENFTRRQVDLLRKARASSNVNQPGVVRTITSSMQLIASTFPTSHLTAWFSLVWSCPPNIKHAVDSQYLLKQSLDCMVQPGVVRST